MRDWFKGRLETPRRHTLLPLRAFALFAVLALVVAACGGDDDGSTETTGDSSETTQPSEETTPDDSDGEDDDGDTGDGESVTITMWDWWVEADPQSANIEDLRQQFMAEHPNITIESRSIGYGDYGDAVIRAAVAEELPDVLMSDVNMTVAWADAGIVSDITDRVEEAGLRDIYFDTRFSAVVADDRVYGLPNSSNTLALYYNADMLEEAGVEPPSDWEELEAAAAALTDGNRKGLVVSANPALIGYQWLPWLWQAGGEVDDLDSEAANRALQIWVDMVNDGSMSPDITSYGHDDLRQQFMAEQVAMMYNGPWNLAALREEADFEWGVVPLPTDETAASVSGGENISITETSENVEAAWTFIEWLQSTEIALDWTTRRGGIPHRTDLAENPVFVENEPFLEPFIIQAESMRPAPPEYGEIWPRAQEIMVDAIHGALVGGLAVGDALATAATEFDALVEEAESS